jgi:hypothetical protein
VKVLTWLWAQPGGRTLYTAQHVNIWADMVRRHLKAPHTIACVTDTPKGIDPSIEIIKPPREFESIRIPTWKEARPQCFRRLAMFRADAAETFGERFLCMDLDCVISGPLDPFLAGDPDFRIARGTSPERPYNGSMVLLKAGARPEVYERFTQEGAAEAGRRFLGSDQAWIAHVLGPNEPTWGEEHGLGWWQAGGKPQPLLFFPGTTKPWDALAHDKHIQTHYRRAGQLRGLILGRGRTLWGEAEAALETGPFDGVIALRETVRHWPGPIAAVATTDEHALALAGMLGYSDITFCGRA